MSWHIENVSKGEIRGYEIEGELCDFGTKYQNIKIARLGGKGVSLILNGRVRVFEIDEYIYHESVVHTSMLHAPCRESVLVIGDGDGGLIRELVKYPEIRNIDWVEIDVEVIQACKQYLPTFPDGLDEDSRIRIVESCGKKYLESVAGDRKYGVIIVSVSGGGDEAMAAPLYESAAFKLYQSVLSESGVICLSLAEVTPVSQSVYAEKIKNVSEYFQVVKPLLIGLPSFGSSWGFALCSMGEMQSIFNVDVPNLRYYSKEQALRDLSLPPYIKL